MLCTYTLYICVYIHVYIFTHTRTHIHVYIHICIRQVHRDVKCANVLLDSDGNVKVENICVCMRLYTNVCMYDVHIAPQVQYIYIYIYEYITA